MVRDKQRGTSLVVQGLRLCTPSAGGLGSIPGQRARFHEQLKVLHTAVKSKDLTCCNLDTTQPHK